MGNGQWAMGNGQWAISKIEILNYEFRIMSDESV
jgi:hypothetical protein